MKQLQLPHKTIATSKLITNIVLVILAAVLAFTPLLSIDMSNSATKEVVDSSLDDIAEENDLLDGVKIELSDKVDISTATMIRSHVILIKMISLLGKDISSIGNELTKQEQEALDKQREEFQEMLESEEGQEALLTTLVLWGQVVDFSSDDTDTAKDDDSVVAIITMVLRLFAVLIIILIITAFPIILAVQSVIKLIYALTKLKDPDVANSKLSSLVPSYLPVVLLFAILLTLFDGLVFGSGLTLLMVICCVNILANIVFSRLRSYEAQDLRYINLFQGSYLVASVGALLFFFNLLNVGVLRNFLTDLTNYVDTLYTESETINTILKMLNRSFTPSALYLIDLILIVFYLAFALNVATNAIPICAARIGLSKAKSSKKTSLIYLGATGLIGSVLPIVVSNLQNGRHYELESSGFENIVVNEAESFSIFTLSSDATSCLIGMIVGSILILGAGIALKVMTPMLCPGMSKEHASDIANGMASAVAVEAPVAVATPIAEESAPVEEAPVAEEAPVEEVVSAEE